MDSAVESMETKGVKLLTNYALSLVVSGHSGVRAFLPTFIMSLVACVAPDYVSLSKSMRWLAHPAAVAGTGLLAVGEMVASMVPVIETIFEAAMTFVHPVMGLVNAIGPDLGDAATAYTQGPMAILGGSQALLLHLAKLAIRAAGLGFLGPFIAVIENVGVGVLVPLAVLFGFFACFLAFCVLASVARWLVRTCKEGAKFASGDLEAKQAARWRKTVNACKRGHSVLSIYYIKEADGFKRAPRAGLLLATLLFQLYLVAWFLRTPAEPIFQNIGVALFLVPFRAAATCVVRRAATYDPKAWPLGPAAGLSLAVVVAGAASLCDEELGKGGVDGSLVLINFLSALILSLCVFEPAQLVLAHDCCAKCCPCLAPCCSDDADIPGDAEAPPPTPAPVHMPIPSRGEAKVPDDGGAPQACEDHDEPPSSEPSPVDGRKPSGTLFETLVCCAP